MLTFYPNTNPVKRTRVESWTGRWETLSTMVSTRFYPNLRIQTNDQPSLGLQLAKLADLPDDVLSEAARVTELLEEKHSAEKASSEAGRIARRRKDFLRVITISPNPRLLLPVRRFILVAHFGAISALISQLRTQLTQAVEHSMLPDQELLEHFARIQREMVAALHDTLPT